MTTNKLNNIDISDIISLYLSGMGSVNIAKQYNVSKPTILYYLKKNNVKIRNNKKHVDEDKAIELYKQGKTPKEIGEVFNVTHTTIRRILINNNIKLRGKREAAEPQRKYVDCIICGKRFNPQANHNRKTCSAECLSTFLSELQTGGKGNNWKGGHSQTYYQKQRILNKEQKCEWCGTTERRLDTHHKDRNKSNNNPDNIMVLCDKCHAKLHYYEDKPKIQGQAKKQKEADIIYKSLDQFI